MTGFAGVGDRRDVARRRAGAAPEDGSTGTGRHERASLRRRRAPRAASASAPSLSGSSNGAWRQTPALERPLPEAVAPGPVARGEARRSGSRRAAARAAPRSSCEYIDRPRVRRAARTSAAARAARAQSRSVSTSVRTGRGGAPRRAHARARPPQRRAPAPRRPCAGRSWSRARRSARPGRRSRGRAIQVTAPLTCSGRSALKPGRALERHRAQRRGRSDVEAHAVALLDRRHGRVLAAPRERPDDREAGGDPRDLRRQQGEAARPTSVNTSSGHSRLSRIAPGGARAASRWPSRVASRRAIGGLVSARRPSRRPITAAITHQPAQTGTSARLGTLRRPASTVTAASAVAAPALSSTVVLRKSTKRTAGPTAAPRAAPARRPARPGQVGLAASSAGPRPRRPRRTAPSERRRLASARAARETHRGRCGRRRRRPRRDRPDIAEQRGDAEPLVEGDRRAHLEHLAPPVHREALCLGERGDLAHRAARRPPRRARRASGRRRSRPCPRCGRAGAGCSVV